MLNHIVISGRMVREPEYRCTDSGIGWCSFTLAVDDDFKDKDGNKQTEFIDCTAWRKTAEYITTYQRKGSQVEVSGRLKSRKWTDKDGNKRTSWFVQVENAYGVGGRKDNQQEQNNQGGFSSGANYAAPAPEYRQPPIYAGEDYAVLTDDDGNLPF